MAKTIASEIARITKNGGVVTNAFNNVAVRHGNMNGFRDGDIFTIPELNGNVVSEPMKRRGQVVTREVDGQQVPVMLQYVLINVTRKRADGTTFETPVAFYPSSLQKTREVADPATKTGTGEYKRAEGTFVDAIDDYDDFNAVFEAFKGRKVAVSLPESKKGFPSMNFDSFSEKTNIYDFNFA